jgi:hypothetical protein
MWTREKVRDLMRDVAQGAADAGDIDDSMAFDIADGVLASEPGLEEFLRNDMGIADPMGYVANYIA